MKILNFLIKSRKIVEIKKRREDKKGNNFMKSKLNSKVKKINLKKMTRTVQFIEKKFFNYLFFIISTYLIFCCFILIYLI